MPDTRCDWSVTSLPQLSAQTASDSDALSTASISSSASSPREICEAELVGALDYLDRAPISRQLRALAAQRVVAASWRMADALERPGQFEGGMMGWQRHALQLRVDIRSAIFSESERRS